MILRLAVLFGLSAEAHRLLGLGRLPHAVQHAPTLHCTRCRIGPTMATADTANDVELPQELSWDRLALCERYPRLRDIAASIRVRRTVEEAELAIQLEAEFNQDPTILRDIDFACIGRRLQADYEATDEVLRRGDILSDEEVEALNKRQQEAQAKLDELVPKYSGPYAVSGATSGAVAETVPKLRRVIARARELPLTVELPTNFVNESGVDVGLVMKESKNIALGAKQVWQRLNGQSPTQQVWRGVGASCVLHHASLP